MAIPLLLVKDVFGLGRQGDLVKVKDGFARNYLVPEGFALPATPAALRKQKRLQEERAQKALVDRAESEEIAQRVQDLTLFSIVKVDQEGHMYGSVSAQDIADLLIQNHNVELHKNAIALKHPIKELGEHTIYLKLKEGVNASFVLKIYSEEGYKQAQADGSAI